MTKQQNGKKPDLVFWFDAPPRAGAGVFRNVAQEWGTGVHYLCAAPLTAERRGAGWKDCDHGKALLTILTEQPEPDHFVRDFIQQHRDAIYVCNGFRGLTAPYLKKWLFPVHGSRIAMWSERPNLYGHRFKQIATLMLHRHLALRYASKIRVYFALGTIGVETFAKCGWDRNILFPFMYDPLSPIIQPHSNSCIPGKPLRMLYVGRFASVTKGVDVIVRALDAQINGDWRLDLVGRNGDYEKQLISWAKNNPRVSYLGVWPSDEVIQRITQYDICLVPSRYDGWNVVTNEALRAGVGVIISDAAASDDLVKASGAGMVVPAGNVNALRYAIQRVIDNPSLADSWKEKARAYSHKITSESVGRYFMDVLEYTFLDPTLPRPQCPWL